MGEYGEEKVVDLVEDVVPQDVGGSNPAKNTTEEAVREGLSTIAVVGIAACVVFLALAATIIDYLIIEKCRKKDKSEYSDASIELEDFEKDTKTSSKNPTELFSNKDFEDEEKFKGIEIFDFLRNYSRA